MHFSRVNHAGEVFLRPRELEEDLIHFAVWCGASQGNQAGTISSKPAAIQYFQLVDVDIELSIRSLWIKSVFQGVSRSDTQAGTRPRGRLALVWRLVEHGAETDTFLGFWGWSVWLSLGTNFFFSPRSDEAFANGSGVVHPAH